jgi:hydroxymethylpyrimidine/phosphomethylpyrimidine kinase
MPRRRSPEAGRPFTVLCVAGTDSAGCSGLAADLRTVTALGGHALLAVTAVTAQDTLRVHAVTPVAPRLVRAQIAAALGDPGADAVKVGMLAGAPVVHAVAAALARRAGAPLVLDPVLRASSGGALLDRAGLRALREVLLPLVDLLTPNLPEAEALLGCRIAGVTAMADAAVRLRELGARAVVLKGGHARGAAPDVCADASGVTVLRAPRIACADTRGTGCVFSTACACQLAQGVPLAEAVRRAKRFVRRAILRSYRLGRGPGPVRPSVAPAGRGPRGSA